MKCVFKVGSTEVLRVSDQRAKEMVVSGAWVYASKKEWKLAGRKRG